MDRSSQIDTFCRLSRVSRETISSLIMYENILIKANKSLNLIGKSTINQIWIRHFLDSYQVIDFIEENDKSLTDIGSGAGFPGIIIGIAAKYRKIPLKVKLIEKSSKKVKFLNETIKELKLNIEVVHQNVLEKEIKMIDDVYTTRAFKPLEVILQLIHKKAKNWKKIIIFLGKNGKNQLLQASKVWDIEYKQRVSITSNDSSVIEINRLRKK
tara:strand:+ start:971 stop:1606 length:636 start_codon:yes stop_codon:yes gene_type:complete